MGSTETTLADHNMIVTMKLELKQNYNINMTITVIVIVILNDAYDESAVFQADILV